MTLVWLGAASCVEPSLGGASLWGAIARRSDGSLRRQEAVGVEALDLVARDQHLVANAQGRCEGNGHPRRQLASLGMR